MDEFDRLVKLPTREDILARIDEYTLYCYYLEKDDIQLGKPMKSPIRDEDDEDRTPSFVIYPAAKGRGFDEFEFTWNDRARGLSGNVFKLVMLMHGLKSFSEAYAMVNQDFGLDLNFPFVEGTKIKRFTAPEIVHVDIRIHSIPFTTAGRAFWDQYNIGQDILDLYKITQIDYYWTTPLKPPHGCLEPTFAYQVGGYYHIYSPYALKANKHRNNLPPNYIFGYLQLPPTGDVLVIDKAMKDLAFCKRLGYWAVAGKAETTMIPPHIMEDLHSRFPLIFLTMDPDKAGYETTEKYLFLYPWLEPRFLTQAKDKTDLCKAVGFDQASQIIRGLLQ